MVNKKPIKKVAKRTVKKVNPLISGIPGTTKVNPFAKQTTTMMNIPVPTKKKTVKKVNPLIVGAPGTIATKAKKKKKAVKKPKFDYSKKFTKK